MIVKTFVFCILSLTGVLYATPEALLMQEMRCALENVKETLHAQNNEFTLFQERVLSLEKEFGNIKLTLKTSPSEKNVERRISHLEKVNETLIADFKTLKTHFNETRDSLANCQFQLNKMDKQLSTDIQGLKQALNSMLALLQTPPLEQNVYIVQSGDSLGQIALKHKTDIKSLKKLNDLSTDTIYSGQKLLIP